LAGRKGSTQENGGDKEVEMEKMVGGKGKGLFDPGVLKKRKGTEWESPSIANNHSEEHPERNTCEG